jgi:hypothetical protein
MAKLPKGLLPIHIAKAVDFVERETADLVDLYFEQANVFSAIVGIFGVKALQAVSPYKKHKHPDVPNNAFRIYRLAENSIRQRHRRLNRRGVRERGPFSPTTTIPDGTLYGAISSIQRRPLNQAGRW